MYEHKTGCVGGFTKKYSVKMLVYYEVFQDSYHAIEREKQIKSGSRKKKIALIEKMNPKWDDLYDRLLM